VPPVGPALFRRFPALVGRIPHRPYLEGPTPVTPADLPGRSGALWVKRDDLSCPLYGGNKPRKLELTVGAAVAKGRRRLVTTGGLGTNHGLATTILAREAGIATTLVLVDQPVTEAVRRSLRLFVVYGAEVVYGRNVAGAAAAVLGVLTRSAWAGERPGLMPTGGSSPLGNLGFVSAGLELADQVAEGLLPPPEEIYVAVGTGGTLAGLVLGLRLAGLPSRVRGVLVTDILPPRPARLARSARRSLALLRRSDPTVPDVALRDEDFTLDADQLGPGYGASTPAADAAVAWASEQGLALETTYTGKCLAEILDRSQRGDLPAGPVLFWNTHNGIDVAARAPRLPEPEALLPRGIRRRLAVPAGSGSVESTP
jgi:D-cysteine desulfhydrase